MFNGAAWTISLSPPFPLPPFPKAGKAMHFVSFVFQKFSMRSRSTSDSTGFRRKAIGCAMFDFQCACILHPKVNRALAIERESRPVFPYSAPFTTFRVHFINDRLCGSEQLHLFSRLKRPAVNRAPADRNVILRRDDQISRRASSEKQNRQQKLHASGLSQLLTSLTRPAIPHRLDRAHRFFIRRELFLFRGGAAVAVGAVDGTLVERA